MTKEQFYNIVQEHSIAGVDIINSLFDCLEYVRLENIQGDIVECGVLIGGNMLGSAEYVNHWGMKRNIWLYDTFEGMVGATEFDNFLEDTSKIPDVYFRGKTGLELIDWCKQQPHGCAACLDYVKNVMRKTSYTQENINFIKGDVCETLNYKCNLPNSISILRLDTDFYLSTKKELEVLYPLLSAGGFLILDDYFSWEGQKKATDEYLDISNFQTFRSSQGLILQKR